VFNDEWDELIDNWLVGGAHPDRINEVVAKTKIPAPPMPVETPTQVKAPAPKPADPAPAPPVVVRSPAPAPAPAPVPGETVSVPRPTPPAPVPLPEPPRKLSIEEKFISRGRSVATTIPVEGETIEMQFYDNAEIDGDSISLFLNGRKIFEHVKLSAEPFRLILPVEELQADNELVMVAENLGEIPPNTSFMLAMVNGKRYSARLESTEHTSAVIRLQRSPGDAGGKMP
jgi:hypothetical protein